MPRRLHALGLIRSGLCLGFCLGLLGGCGTPPSAAPPVERGDGGIEGDASVSPSVCPRPATGCPCEPGTAPIECYPDAETRADGSRVCLQGTRSCRDGSWSACESIQRSPTSGSEPGRASMGLIGTSEECDDCNPACSRTTDEPDDGDIDPEDGLEYCNPPGGLCLVPMEPPPPPPPAGCDVWYEISFGESVTHDHQITLPATSGSVSVFPEDNAATGYNEANLVSSVVATGCPSCAPGASGRYCEGCASGAAVQWTITFHNDAFVPTMTERILEFDLVTVSDPLSAPMEINRQHACLRVPPVDSMCLGNGFGCMDNASCCSGLCVTTPAFDPAFAFSECASSAAACRGDGAPCASAVDCCRGGCVSGYCDPTASCRSVGSACTAAADCCTNDCAGDTCAARSCRAQNDVCTNDGQCCSGNCKSNGRCGSGSTCLVSGESCTGDGDCCSTWCDAGSCRALSFCRAAGEVCAADGECCGLSCAGGYCEIISTQCLPRYSPCSQSSECCGLRCDADPNGISRCLALGGCRVSGPTPGSPFGENCSSGAQCCSGLCEADSSGDLRCRRLNTANSGCAISPDLLAPNGELCNNDCQCSSNNCDMLAVSIAHQRCREGGPCHASGETCAVPEDCCGSVCAFWPDSVYRCGLPPEMVYTMGTFTRTWDGRESSRGDGSPGCAPNERPDWGELTWTSTINPDTRIRFEFQTAETLAGLDAAPVVSFTEPPATPPKDIGALLVAGGQPNYARYLRMTVVLISDDGRYTPVLHDFSLEWVCTPVE